ncbi:uncharacterized protein LOC111352141 isoform X4 [Spodoptera litura]|uniref:Uncharacterized protein LOC111352141 isoform X4 n=1 Tax=Spodoptera litura TaxID=69820 RepID=A0A9J7DXU4_SPOLT|nr:uncharacterized protein LOC111352141 isoform X4 [Spodoptera litura]
MATKEESLLYLLEEIAAEQNYENPNILVKAVCSGGANYTSKIYKAVVKAANKEDLYLFAKCAMLGIVFRSKVPILIYDTEQYAYDTLVKLYDNIQDQCELPAEQRISFCRCYGFRPDRYEEILVLEDLEVRGYGSYDRFKSLDWQYSSAAITELAKLHALSFALKQYFPREFDEALYKIKVVYEENSDIIMDKPIESALRTVRSEYKETLAVFLEKHRKDMYLSALRSVRSTVIVHGDFRPNNLMHKMREDGTVDIKIVDLQTLQGGSPVTDLIYFIFTGSDEKFRAQYFDKLLDHYYTELSAAMKRLQLNPDEVFSRADFDYEMKEKLPFGLTLAVFTLPVITVEMENAPQVDESLDISKFNVEKTSDLYAERLNGVVNDYVKWGILK